MEGSSQDDVVADGAQKKRQRKGLFSWHGTNKDKPDEIESNNSSLGEDASIHSSSSSKLSLRCSNNNAQPPEKGETNPAKPPSSSSSLLTLDGLIGDDTLSLRTTYEGVASSPKSVPSIRPSNLEHAGEKESRMNSVKSTKPIRSTSEHEPRVNSAKSTKPIRSANVHEPRKNPVKFSLRSAGEKESRMYSVKSTKSILSASELNPRLNSAESFQSNRPTILPDPGALSVKSFHSLIMPVEEEILEEVEPPPKSRARKCKDCCQQLIAFLFSSVGLTCLLCGYTLLGGVIFKELEAPNEVRLKGDVMRSREWHVKQLWKIREIMDPLHPEKWNTSAEDLLKNYTRKVFMATKHGGWDGKDGAIDIQWTFAGSLLYSITVITTIGYGHIAPRTNWGRIVTMLYAIVGIPLTLLTLANLGGFMATAFRFIYKNICCGLCCCQIPWRKKNKYKDPQPNDKAARISLTGVGQTNRNKPQERKHKCCCFLCCRCRKSTKKTKPPTPQHDDGVPTASSLDDSTNKPLGDRGDVPEQIAREVRFEGSDNASIYTEDKASVVRFAVSSRGRSRSLTSVRLGIPANFKPEEREERVSVPISVSLLLLIGYILSGAVLFTLWEPEWDYLISSYFCFITLSTIGFGDYVPGTSIDSWASQQKHIFSSIYLLVGLAFIMMCFELMQEEARNKVRCVARKVGLIENKDKTANRRMSKNTKNRRGSEPRRSDIYSLFKS